MKTTRKVVKINEAKCNGCGICVPSCAEGALKIIGGKARLVSDTYCDGLGACLYECPQGAITIEERQADEFNETAAKQHHSEGKSVTGHAAAGCPSAKARVLKQSENITAACGCSSATVQSIGKPASASLERQTSQLNHWPVQLTLVPPVAPFLKGADVVLAADCTAFAYADFHRDFLTNRALLVACPKLDDFEAHLKKLTDIIAKSALKSLTVVRMEVPCCSGLSFMAQQAIAASNNHIPFREIVISVKGELKD
jgi:NAD-dependent dihydropyrimidine dehydrogenase PreA subunit